MANTIRRPEARVVSTIELLFGVIEGRLCVMPIVSMLWANVEEKRDLLNIGHVPLPLEGRDFSVGVLTKNARQIVNSRCESKKIGQQVQA